MRAEYHRQLLRPSRAQCKVFRVLGFRGWFPLPFLHCESLHVGAGNDKLRRRAQSHCTTGMQGSSGHEAWDVHVDTGVSGGTLIEAAAGLLELKFNIGVPPGLESALKEPSKIRWQCRGSR